MADPVSSVAYAIEAALRAVNGDLVLLLPTMGLVVALIALIFANSHQLVARFPEGGGAAAGGGGGLRRGWAFVPIGALIVDGASLLKGRARVRDQRSVPTQYAG